MKKIAVFLILVLGPVINLLAQPANDQPCGAILLQPTASTCSPYSDDTQNSTTSLLKATKTVGEDIFFRSCDFENTDSLSDVWFKIAKSSTSMQIQVQPIEGFEPTVQVYAVRGSCTGGFSTFFLFGCVRKTAEGYLYTLPGENPDFPYPFDSLYVRVFDSKGGQGIVPPNGNSQFSICSYFPPPQCPTLSSPFNGQNIITGTLGQNITLNWNVNYIHTMYRVYLGTDPENLPLYKTVKFNSQLIIPGNELKGGKYFWYVVSANDTIVATGCDEAIRNFTVQPLSPNNLLTLSFRLPYENLSCEPYSDSTFPSRTSYFNATRGSNFTSTRAYCNNTQTVEKDVWFTFTPKDSVWLTVTVQPVEGINTSFRVSRALFPSGIGSSGPVLMGCADNGGIGEADTLTFLGIKNMQYFIQVFPSFGSDNFLPEGNSQFNICITKALPACPSPSFMVAPAPNSDNVDHIEGEFQWKNVARATDYTVLLGTEEDNLLPQKTIRTQQIFSQDITRWFFGINYQYTSSPLFPKSKYYWKVVPNNNGLENTGCSIPARSFTTLECPNFNLFSPFFSATNSGEIEFRLQCPNCKPEWPVIEFGPNLNSGDGITPAAGNTVLYPTNPIIEPYGFRGYFAVDSPQLIPTYWYHVRAVGCTTSFTRTLLPISALSGIAIFKTCQDTTINIMSGIGRWDFGGNYPVNSVGNPTPGRMSWFQYTPAENGVYYLDVDSLETNVAVDYLYKPDSLNVYSPADWTGIATVQQKGKFPIGYLTKDITYFFAADRQDTAQLPPRPGGGPPRHRIKICKATTDVAPASDSCLDFSLANNIPANSPKEEFIIDEAGNLIAAIQPGSGQLGKVRGSYYVHSGSVRYDDQNKEYLNRSITINSSSNEAGGHKVSLFFTNSELQQLIDEPKDGVADVSKLEDLVVTKTEQECAPALKVGNNNNTLLNPIARGIYDENTRYVTVESDRFSSFFLHGGNNILLPVLFTHFEAIRSSSSIDLSWSAIENELTQNYEIEKWGANQFVSIGHINAKRQAGRQQYTFRDAKPQQGANIYRIKQKDFDGSSTLSKVQSVLWENGTSVKVWPTITSGEVNISGLSMGSKMEVFDATGKLFILQKSKQDTNRVYLNNYARGIYYIKVTSNEMQIQIFRIVKL